MLEGVALRSSARRARGGAKPSSSCDLLASLAEHEAVAEVLREVGIGPGNLAELRERIAAEIEPEPADWHLRLQQRGGRPGPDGELAQLLAIVRSADCHAYRQLQLAGADTGRLRKLLIERLRQRSGARAAQSSHPSGPVTRPSTGPRPTRRRASTLETDGAPVATAAAAAAPVSRRSAGSRSRPTPPSPRRSRRSAALAPNPEPSEPASVKPAAASPRAIKGQAEGKAEVRASSRSHSQRELRSIPAASLPPFVGRERELGLLADALLRRAPRPPLLVGEHGSGRTRLATELAAVLDAPLFRLEAPDYSDEDELSADLEQIAEAGGVAILDDLDRVASEAPPALLPALARAWARGAPRLLCIVSHETRARLEAWMPGILDTLDVLVLAPLEGTEVHRAVKLASPAVLAEHGVELAPAAQLSELTRIADRFLTGLAMPGRALDLLDLACARRVRHGAAIVDHAAWVDVACERTGLPRSRVEGRGERDMLDLDVQLRRQVVGHEHVLEALAALVRRNRAGFASGRPIASVLLLGPSGVGKTEIAKALAAALFEGDDALLRLDMSEYAEAHAVARVVGAPPGYVGHEHGGALSDPMVRNPHRVVLLDEIEKSHRDVHQLLLQVFDEGRLTDGRGRTVDFRHALVIMTSNLGAELLVDGAALPDEAVLERARSHFPVELWNRIEAPLVLRPLTRAQMLAVCRRLLAASSARLAQDRGIRYRVDDEVVERLIDRAGIDPALGARPLRHLLGREVESLLAEAILRGRVRAGDEARVTLDAGRLAVEVAR